MFFDLLFLFCLLFQFNSRCSFHRTGLFLVHRVIDYKTFFIFYFILFYLLIQLKRHMALYIRLINFIFRNRWKGSTWLMKPVFAYSEVIFVNVDYLLWWFILNRLCSQVPYNHIFPRITCKLTICCSLSWSWLVFFFVHLIYRLST